MAFIYLGYNPDQYKGHSFRIGAAAKAAECGLCETQIQQMGRGPSLPSKSTSEFLSYFAD